MTAAHITPSRLAWMPSPSRAAIPRLSAAPVATLAV